MNRPINSEPIQVEPTTFNLNREGRTIATAERTKFGQLKVTITGSESKSFCVDSLEEVKALVAFADELNPAKGAT